MSNRREYHRNYKRRQRALEKSGLKVHKQDEGNSLVMDSRQVAVIVGKDHKHLMRDIRGYVAVLETSPDLDPSNFFMPSTYEDAKGETRPSYLLTKQGCEMVGNKLTGEKGILFTATYVSRFNEMENLLGRGLVLGHDVPIEDETDTDSILEDLEVHLKAVKLSADILEVDQATLLQMMVAVHEHHGIPTSHLIEQKAGEWH